MSLHQKYVPIDIDVTDVTYQVITKLAALRGLDKSTLFEQLVAEEYRRVMTGPRSPPAPDPEPIPPPRQRLAQTDEEISRSRPWETLQGTRMYSNFEGRCIRCHRTIFTDEPIIYYAVLGRAIHDNCAHR